MSQKFSAWSEIDLKYSVIYWFYFNGKKPRTCLPGVGGGKSENRKMGNLIFYVCVQRDKCLGWWEHAVLLMVYNKKWVGNCMWLWAAILKMFVDQNGGHTLWNGAFIFMPNALESIKRFNVP